MLLQPGERVEVEHLGSKASVLDAHVGEDGGGDERRDGGIVESGLIAHGLEAVEQLDVLGKQGVVHVPKPAEPFRAFVSLDAPELAEELLRLPGKRRDTARCERIARDAHLLGGGDDDLEHNVLSMSR